MVIIFIIGKKHSIGLVWLAIWACYSYGPLCFQDYRVYSPTRRGVYFVWCRGTQQQTAVVHPAYLTGCNNRVKRSGWTTRRTWLFKAYRSSVVGQASCVGGRRDVRVRECCLGRVWLWGVSSEGMEEWRPTKLRDETDLWSILLISTRPYSSSTQPSVWVSCSAKNSFFNYSTAQKFEILFICDLEKFIETLLAICVWCVLLRSGVLRNVYTLYTVYRI